MEFDFQTLEPVETFRDLADPARYRSPPGDWWIVVTDVVGSTVAIEEGRYKDVNMLGAASIVAARNAAGGISIPYVFGGDGATMVVPASKKGDVAASLRGLADLADEIYGLGLRVGGVPVATIIAEGAPFGVARFRLAEGAELAMFWGDGVGLAEEMVKSDDGWGFDEYPILPDLGGLECRWKPVPARNGMILSVLVKAIGGSSEERARTYLDLFSELDRLDLTGGDGRPLDVDRLEITTDSGDLLHESTLKSAARGARLGAVHRRTRLKTHFGSFLMKRGWSFGGFSGDSYGAATVARSDFRKFDDALRMVIDIDDETREMLEAVLAQLRSEGRIAYGTFASSEALVTCMIEDHDTRHVHFIDGADGGYALAAKGLKAQLREGPP